jgi:putative membrane protein
MIEYDRRDWRSHLFDIHGSLLPEIFARMLSCVVWSAALVLLIDGLKQYNSLYPGEGNWRPEWFMIPASVHSLVGFAIGLLLVMRTNSSYDRFWEGRKLWGGIVNETRNLARATTVHIKRNAPLCNELVRWTIAWSWASMFHLRGRREVGPVADRLPAADVDAVLLADHVPLEISRRITQLLVKARDEGHVSDIVLTSLDQNTQLLIDYLGGCERIHKTPLPFAYMVHLRRAIILYLYTFPLAIVREWDWLTVVATLVVSFVFFGIEEIGVEIEDPFEGDTNDIPLEAICGTIDRNLSSLIGDIPSNPPPRILPATAAAAASPQQP